MSNATVVSTDAFKAALTASKNKTVALKTPETAEQRSAKVERARALRAEAASKIVPNTTVFDLVPISPYAIAATLLATASHEVRQEALNLLLRDRSLVSNIAPIIVEKTVTKSAAPPVSSSSTGKKRAVGFMIHVKGFSKKHDTPDDGPIMKSKWSDAYRYAISILDQYRGKGCDAKIATEFSGSGNTRDWKGTAPDKTVRHLWIEEIKE